MSDPNSDSTGTTLILLLREPRAVSLQELRQAVAAEAGQEASATVTWVGANASGAEYFEWRDGFSRQHLGTFNRPYIRFWGVGRLGAPMRWHMQEEEPPDGTAHREAWMAHNAWLYVDALHSSPESSHGDDRQIALRIASRFVDDRCVLLWLFGGDSKRVALPSAEAVAALRNGRWPG